MFACTAEMENQSSSVATAVLVEIVELATKILGYIPPEYIQTCAAVCTTWRYIVNTISPQHIFRGIIRQVPLSDPSAKLIDGKLLMPTEQLMYDIGQIDNFPDDATIVPILDSYCRYLGNGYCQTFQHTIQHFTKPGFEWRPDDRFSAFYCTKIEPNGDSTMLLIKDNIGYIATCNVLKNTTIIRCESPDMTGVDHNLTIIKHLPEDSSKVALYYEEEHDFIPHIVRYDFSKPSEPPIAIVLEWSVAGMILSQSGIILTNMISREMLKLEWDDHNEIYMNGIVSFDGYCYVTRNFYGCGLHIIKPEKNYIEHCVPLYDEDTPPSTKSIHVVGRYLIFVVCDGKMAYICAHNFVTACNQIIFSEPFLRFAGATTQGNTIAVTFADRFDKLRMLILN